MIAEQMVDMSPVNAMTLRLLITIEQQSRVTWHALKTNLPMYSQPILRFTGCNRMANLRTPTRYAAHGQRSADGHDTEGRLQRVCGYTFRGDLPGCYPLGQRVNVVDGITSRCSCTAKLVYEQGACSKCYDFSMRDFTPTHPLFPDDRPQQCQ
jgi:hypothetical protein